MKLLRPVHCALWMVTKSHNQVTWRLLGDRRLKNSLWNPYDHCFLKITRWLYYDVACGPVTKLILTLLTICDVTPKSHGLAVLFGKYLFTTNNVHISFFSHLLLTFKLWRVFCVCPIIYGHQCIFIFHERNSATLAEYPNLWAHNTKWCLRIELMLEIPSPIFFYFHAGTLKNPIKN